MKGVLILTTLIQAARAAARTKGTYLYAQYHRIAARRGANRACVAVAHTIIVIVYNMIKNLQPYCELGESYFEKRRQQAIARKAIKQLEDLGVQGYP